MSIRNEQIVEESREKMTQTTLAWVTALIPNSHSTITYEFFVDGRKYTENQILGSDYLVGSSYVVHYNPSDPSSSFLGDIPSESSGIHWFYLKVFAGILLISSIVTFILECLGIVSSH